MNPGKWIVFTLVLIVLATALQIAGLVAPCWIYLKTSDYRVGVGLYFRVGCEASSGNNCTHPAFPTSLAFGYNSESTYDEPEWEAMAWLQTISAVTALTLCVMMVVYLIGFGVWRRMGALNMLMTVVCVFTWLINVTGLILFVIYYGDVITKSSDRQSFPWSALMVFIAAILFIIITILIRLRCRNRNYLQHAIPTSADSKMALNPSTKNQVMKRYFTPSPYREGRREGITNNGGAPAIASTDQSRLLMAGQQHSNNLGLNALEYGQQVNGNTRYYPPGWQKELREEGVIETQQLRPGITASSPSVNQLIYGQRGINYREEAVTTEFSEMHRRQMLMQHQQQLEQQKQKELQQQQLQQQHTIITGKQTSLAHHTHDVFDDTAIGNVDTETIFYRGAADVTPKNFSFVPGVTTDQGQPLAYGYGYTNGGYLTENTARREQLTTFYTKDSMAVPSAPQPGSRRASVSSYRMGVEHQEGEPFRELGTTHMRRPEQNLDRNFTGAPLANGDGYAYSRKFMYRPYSEQSY